MIRWTHIHTAAVAAAAGGYIATHTLALVVAAAGCYTAGCVTVIVYGRARRVAAACGRAAVRAAADRSRLTRARARELRSRADHRVRSRAQQDDAVRRSYIRGATDAAHHWHGCGL